MIEATDDVLKHKVNEGWFSRFQVAAVALLAMLAIISKFYLSRLVPNTQWLELPLLLTVYFGLARRSQIQGLLFGAGVGLAEDSLAPDNLPIGMYGITKTLVGYFAASVSLRFNVDSWVVRSGLCFFFYIFHELFYWIMRRALLGQIVPLDLPSALVHAGLNALAAIPLFLVLDKLKVSGTH